MRIVRITNCLLSLQTIMSRMLATTVTPVVGSVAMVVLAATSLPSSAQSNNCVSSSYLPGTAPLLLQHPDGRYIHLQADSLNFQRGAHLWVNGVYEAFYTIPFHVYSENDVRVELKQSLRSEIWMGAVRSPVIRQIPIVIACNGWFGDLR
jgi:hypothetical protein